MRLGRDGIAGLVGLAVSLTLLPFAFGLPKLPIVPIGPGFYPALVSHPSFASYGLVTKFGSVGDPFNYWIFRRR